MVATHESISIQENQPDTTANTSSYALTYQDLVTRYGTTAAYGILLTVEKVARIKNSIADIDEESRLQKALTAINSNSEPAARS